MISDELQEAAAVRWAPRPRTPAHRVKATLDGPGKGVDPAWWASRFGAQPGDVDRLDLEDVLLALSHAGRPAPSDLEKGRDLLRKLVGVDRARPPQKPRRSPKWADLSREEKEAAIEDAIMAHGEVGRRISRAHARALARKHYG